MLADVVDKHDFEALNKWRSQFTAKECYNVSAFYRNIFHPFLIAAAKSLPLAMRTAGCFHAAKDGDWDGRREERDKTPCN